eukprot:SM000137S00476  [mRNA]  locus=s137:377235:386446:- [translate_table: standard]
MEGAARAQALAAVDAAFVAVVRRMWWRLQRDGPGAFLLIDDGGSSRGGNGGGGNAAALLPLPTILFRRARGLLARLPDHGDDGQRLLQGVELRGGDAFALGGELLADPAALLALLDGLAGGELLQQPPQSATAASGWQREAPWLPALGWFSLPAFVASRLEVCLWDALLAMGAAVPRAVPSGGGGRGRARTRAKEPAAANSRAAAAAAAARRLDEHDMLALWLAGLPSATLGRALTATAVAATKHEANAARVAASARVRAGTAPTRALPVRRPRRWWGSPATCPLAESDLSLLGSADEAAEPGWQLQYRGTAATFAAAPWLAALLVLLEAASSDFPGALLRHGHRVAAAAAAAASRGEDGWQQEASCAALRDQRLDGGNAGAVVGRIRHALGRARREAVLCELLGLLSTGGAVDGAGRGSKVGMAAGKSKANVKQRKKRNVLQTRAAEGVKEAVKTMPAVVHEGGGKPAMRAKFDNQVASKPLIEAVVQAGKAEIAIGSDNAGRVDSGGDGGLWQPTRRQGRQQQKHGLGSGGRLKSSMAQNANCALEIHRSDSIKACGCDDLNCPCPGDAAAASNKVAQDGDDAIVDKCVILQSVEQEEAGVGGAGVTAPKDNGSSEGNVAGKWQPPLEGICIGTISLVLPQPQLPPEPPLASSAPIEVPAGSIACRVPMPARDRLPPARLPPWSPPVQQKCWHEWPLWGSSAHRPITFSHPVVAFTPVLPAASRTEAEDLPDSPRCSDAERLHQQLRATLVASGICSGCPPHGEEIDRLEGNSSPSWNQALEPPWQDNDAELGVGPYAAAEHFRGGTHNGGAQMASGEAEEDGQHSCGDDRDYHEIFGGGVLYWTVADLGVPAELPASYSSSAGSEESWWARREADAGAVLDDIRSYHPASLLLQQPPLHSEHPSASSSPLPASAAADLHLLGYAPPGELVAFISKNSAVTKDIPDADSKMEGAVEQGSMEGGGKGAACLPEKEDHGVSEGGSHGRAGGGGGDAILHDPRLRPILVRTLPAVQAVAKAPGGGGSHSSGSLLQSFRYSTTPPISRQSSAKHVWDAAAAAGGHAVHVPGGGSAGRREGDRCGKHRPSSPVLRSVPPALPPPPPPPSPVSGASLRRKSFQTARSGSSSPRHWEAAAAISSASVSRDHEKAVRTIKRRLHGAPMGVTILHPTLAQIPPLCLEPLEHPDMKLPMRPWQTQPAAVALESHLHQEMEAFCVEVANEVHARKQCQAAAIKRLERALQVLWPRSRVKRFGSTATGLALPTSDVDIVVCLPPVRNLEPIKEAGILEGRNGIKETCLQHAARYLADQDWVKSDSITIIENTAVPILKLVAQIPNSTASGTSLGGLLPPKVCGVAGDGSSTQMIWGGPESRMLVRMDVSFEGPSHTGLRTAELVRELCGEFPAIIPLALVLKQFLTDRSLDHPYTGGLSSYCLVTSIGPSTSHAEIVTQYCVSESLVLLITRFLQHQQHVKRNLPSQSLGSLLMGFLHFFGCVFDPRRVSVSIWGGGMYVERSHVYSIDPLCIEDPLDISNNVGRNCFRVLQCTKVASAALVAQFGELPTANFQGDVASAPLAGIAFSRLKLK